jgi:pyridoxine 5-phosphate synthase
MQKLRLGINIDHVATLRNARGGIDPCPIRAAQLAKDAGADGITAHLREDRRHIKDRDIERLKNEIDLPLNLEMAATAEMLAIALKTKPHAVCLVPEKREELTTEGGLDAAKMEKFLIPIVEQLQDNGSRVSLFIAPFEKQIEAALRIGARAIELHTGSYAEAITKHGFESKEVRDQASFLFYSAEVASKEGLEVHAGHGLTYDNVSAIAMIPHIIELNIGHFLIGESVFVGLKESIQKMRRIMDKARTS